MTETPPSETAATGPESTDCVWLYCVGQADLTVPAELTGVAGEPVALIRADGLTALAGHVPVSEFGSAALRTNLEDMDWLSRCAQAHHQVISEAAQRGVVLPMRLATLYQSETGVTGLLSGRAEQLKAAIADVTGCAEYGLKGYAQTPPGAAAHATRDVSQQMPTQQDAPAGKPGTAYLKQRRAALDAQSRSRQVAAQEAEQCVRELATLTLGERDHPLHDRSLDPAAADMILNVSYLVADASSEDFEAAVGELAAKVPMLRLELTGPWPPYSFATVQDPAVEDLD